jgi:hypothetical protein
VAARDTFDAEAVDGDDIVGRGMGCDRNGEDEAGGGGGLGGRGGEVAVGEVGDEGCKSREGGGRSSRELRTGERRGESPSTSDVAERRAAERNAPTGILC